MFTAGYNMPGYLPENDPAQFDSFEEAVTYLVGIVDEFWNQDYEGMPDHDKADAKWLDIHTALHNIGNANAFTDYAGGYVFWISPTV